MYEENYYNLTWSVLHQNNEGKTFHICGESDDKQFRSEKAALNFFNKHKNDLDKNNFELFYYDENGWEDGFQYLGGNTKEDYTLD